MYKLFICLRYLRARTISYIAIGALGLGVATLIIVTSVMGGFQREFHKKIRGTLADISVESRIFFGIKDPETLQREIEKHPRVRASAPVIENIVLIDTEITKDYGFLKGIDPVQEARIGEFAKTVLSPREIIEARYEGEPAILRAMRDVLDAASNEKPDPKEVFRTRSGRPGLLVGVQLFVYMKMDVGDEVTLVTTSNLDRKRAEEKDVREMTFEVVGAFKTGMFEQDKRFLYAPLAPAQEFIGARGALSGINVRLDDYRAAEEVALDLAASLGDRSLYVLPWNKRNENLIRAVATERWMIGFIVFFMIALAGLNLTAILTMSVIEKTKDLGILGAVGGTRSGLMSIFLFQGGLIAVMGSVLGSALGFLFVDNINWIDRNVMAAILGHPVFDPEVYYLDTIPTEVNPAAILLCCGATIVLGFALAIYPAVRASRLEPIEALRYE
jgi:lipoprotein-releasing system permease protein